jgi:hypothetical protein
MRFHTEREDIMGPTVTQKREEYIESLKRKN